ncbi:nuclear transcription factor Y subunit B-7-like [Neltuma alba]|uniref:nuclear transcription factor Y subunit B-7-like n=1 Tax=Neltuma alba TaxID=207710 RepID=UPI0010A55461|nr:nuclear transcription factor Y subunit B-7-like [Prosopis alba]
MKEESPSTPNLPSTGSPESPCFKSSSSTNKEQDRFLPIANVGRIMKKVMPANGKISKDAKETVQECVSEFISFVTGEASDKCQREKRKTINGDDIIWAITTLGFEDYVDPLKSYLQKYREIEGEKLNIPKQQRSDHHHQQRLQNHHHHHQEHNNNANSINFNNNNLPLNNSVYSSTILIPPPPPPPPPCVTTDQTFSLPFSSNSIQKQLQPQDNMDSSVGNW